MTRTMPELHPPPSLPPVPHAVIPAPPLPSLPTSRANPRHTGGSRYPETSTNRKPKEAKPVIATRITRPTIPVHPDRSDGHPPTPTNPPLPPFILSEVEGPRIPTTPSLPHSLPVVPAQAGTHVTQTMPELHPPPSLPPVPHAVIPAPPLPSLPTSRANPRHTGGSRYPETSTNRKPKEAKPVIATKITRPTIPVHPERTHGHPQLPPILLPLRSS